jgi:putative endonuclease
MDAYMYILKCSDESYYTGSTRNLSKRISEHNSGSAANYTRRRLPVVLVYFEYFERIEDAFHREKQVQKWSAAKKEALIKRDVNLLKQLSACKNLSHFSIQRNSTLE